MLVPAHHEVVAFAAEEEVDAGAAVETVAACASLTPADIRVGAHNPVGASLGNPFVIAEVEPSALPRATPDFASFRGALEQTPALNGRLGLYIYAQAGEGSVHARMFAPLGGTIEDAATGSAAPPSATSSTRPAWPTTPSC